MQEETGTVYATVFQLRVVTDDKDKEIRKRHTKPVFDKKQRRMVDKLDEAAFVGDLLDAGIVGWTGVQGRSGADVPCTTEMKHRLQPRKKNAPRVSLVGSRQPHPHPLLSVSG